MEFYFKFRGLVLTVTANGDADGKLEVEKVMYAGIEMSDFTDEEYEQMEAEADAKAMRDEGFWAQ